MTVRVLHRLTAFMASLLRLISAEAPVAVLQVTFLLHLPAHGGVPVVFNRVVCPKNKIQILESIPNTTVRGGEIINSSASPSGSETTKCCAVPFFGQLAMLKRGR